MNLPILSCFMFMCVGVALSRFTSDEPPNGIHDKGSEDRLALIESLLERQNLRLQQLENHNQMLEDIVKLLSAENSELRTRTDSGDAIIQELKDSVFVLNQKLVLLEKAFNAASPVTPTLAMLKAWPAGAYRTQKVKPNPLDAVEHQKTSQTQKTVNIDSLETENLADSKTLDTRADDLSPLEPVVSQMSQRLTEVSAEVEALKQSNVQQDVSIRDAASSVYVRWGHSACPNSSTLVYWGVVGGSYFDHVGAASNYLCLSMSPVMSDHTVPPDVGYVYGGEYETEIDSHHQKDPVCAVCRSQHATTIMVPGTNVCMQGWNTEYSGYLMAGYHGHNAASEYICVDSAFENRYGSDRNENGKLLYFTVAQCGTLPCDPYVGGKIVTCVVCSK